MNSKNLTLFLALAAIGMSSCKKDTAEAPRPSTSITAFNQIQAPSGFDFNATKTIYLQFAVENQGFTNAYIIEVFDSNPLAKGGLIYKGFTSNNQLTAEIEVPSALKRLIIKKTAPDGSSETKELAINGNSVNYLFAKKSTVKKVAVVSTSCNTGCDYSYNNRSSNITIDNNDPSGVYCFTGTTTADIHVHRTDVVVRICGTADISKIHLKENARVEIVDGANVDLDELDLDDNVEIEIFDATVFVDSDASIEGTITNHGSLSMNDELTIEDDAIFVNNGTLTVNDEMAVEDDATLTNNGSLSCSKKIELKFGSTTTNSCSMTTSKELKIEGILNNSGYIEATKKVEIKSGSTVNLFDGSMLYGKDDGKIESTVTGSGSTSLMKFDDKGEIKSGGSLNGTIELCVLGSYSNSGSINSPAVRACDQVYIATSSCNPVGNGTFTVLDSDNDNVADDQDAYPNDADRAGDSYYPNQNGFATLAFEDLWPGKGDNDFNDLVIQYRIHYVTDASNKVKDMIFEYSVIATGASQRNGFAVELDINPTVVSSVVRTGSLGNSINLNANGTEAGQTNTVLVFFDNTNDELPNMGTAFVNTVKSAPYSTPKLSSLSATFSTSQDASSLAINPFMIVNQERDKEIHLAGYAPTDLADQTLFGNNADRSVPGNGIYYVDENNLPWVISLPAAFDYPSEKDDIVQAYTYFATWAESGGLNSTDWYISNSGYRNLAVIY